MEITRVINRGRKRGSGCNLFLLRKLKPGDCIWNVPAKKMKSLAISGWRAGYKLRIRRLPNQLYGIWRIT